jgi:hypothetical protein
MTRGNPKSCREAIRKTLGYEEGRDDALKRPAPMDLEAGHACTTWAPANPRCPKALRVSMIKDADWCTAA